MDAAAAPCTTGTPPAMTVPSGLTKHLATATTNPRKHALERLDYYYDMVSEIILSRQHPATGLIPASVAVTSHGDYRDAWTRDNVYSILAVWGLALAYRRVNDNLGRAYELEHAVVKCMRGLLFAMMRQAHKVETFKNTQNPFECLHAKYNTATGDTVVGDDQWGHLQIDATSIYLLFLGQMTASGLRIIFTKDEVDFIQNLVFYIERAYRTPDYGIWERGNKANHGQTELNSSSIGMAVAALEAMKGLNLFGPMGGPTSVIHSLADETSRNFTTLMSALPRESNSKEVDAALLSVIGFPAFAVPDMAMVQRTRDAIESKLGGKYGCKRFLRDGHQTSVEDTSRLHYEPNELLVFEHIECEWPLFFTYLILDGIFFEDHERKREYQKKLEACLVHERYPLVPELFIVPEESVEAERQQPKSQLRVPNENLPLVWAQSLYVLGRLLEEQLLHVAEIDPLGRRVAHRLRPAEPIVQVVLLAEDEALQARLAQYGVQADVLTQEHLVRITHPNALKEAFALLGANSKLNLTGRPKRPVGILGTSKIYRVQGDLYAFTPSFMDLDEFYLIRDNEYLVTILESEFAFLKSNWRELGRPTVTLMLTHAMLASERMTLPLGRRASISTTPASASRRTLLHFFTGLKSGMCGSVPVRLGRLSDFVHSSCIESLDFLLDKPAEWQGILAHESQHAHCERLHLSEFQAKTFKLGRFCMRESYSLTTSPDFMVDHVLNSPLVESGFPDRLFSLPSPHPNGPAGVAEKARSVSRGPSSPQVAKDNMLHLTLGDPAHTAEAMALLVKSCDLQEQADLLHYLTSCYGLDHVTELGTLRELLEEVYKKVLAIRNWGVVRLVAGTLKKTVSSLTINITDLIVRRKQVTIGFSASSVHHPNNLHEAVVNSPLGPAAIANLIFQHCMDPREAVLAQEIITCLGALIRSDPDLFRGIIQVRVHYLLLAMRDEIMRLKGLAEREAMEYMLALSPSQVVTLVTSIFSTNVSLPNDLHHTGRAPSPNIKVVSGAALAPVGSSLRSAGATNGDSLVVTAQSAGYLDGNFAKVQVGAMQLVLTGRGLHVVVIDPVSGVVIEQTCFDTCAATAESEDLADFLASIDDDLLVALAACDDFTSSLGPRAKAEIARFGSKFIDRCQYRDSFCLVAVRERLDETVEAYSAMQKGATNAITFQFKLDALMAPSDACSWLRKRRNDGALNRVPKEFYPHVWHVLDRSQGIELGQVTLPREPTVSDKTAGEFNFALQIENLLDGVPDPAERQICIELLMLIWEHLDKTPDMRLPAVIPVTQIIRDAVNLFWKHKSCGTRDQPADTPSLSASKLPVGESVDSLLKDTTGGNGKIVRPSRLTLDSRFEKNAALARQQFFDLPPDAENGTAAFLKEAMLAALPGLE
ncbi:hypothetical protein GGF31_005825 [Allomyces arbusculus]|nr:hypothetical protein GGF31_005825 [Allomyces arbusculus]